MKVKLYIVCHDFKSEDVALQLKKDWNENNGLDISIIKPHNTQYLESDIYIILDDCKHEWVNFDYIGIVSYSILLKLESFMKQKVNFNWQQILKEIEKHKFDIIGLFGLQYVKNNYPISMLEGACFQHGLNFHRSWYILLNNIGYNDDQIYDKNVLPFLCNWWISKPNLMLDYIQFYKTCRDKIEKNSLLKDLIESNSFYTSGNLSANDIQYIFKKPFYTLTPFIFERLPCFYFHHKFVKTGYFMKFTLQI